MPLHKQLLRNNICSIALIAGIALLAALPMMLDCHLGSHDIIYHQIYSRVYSKQLWAGEIYPRWISSMNAGFGSPTFFYYAPLPYFLSSLFAPLARGTGIDCSTISYGSALALAASGIAMSTWLRTMVRPESAFFGAVIYMLLPYHLSIDLYVRTAYAELWSFVWMPLALYFTAPALRGSSRALVGLAASLACLILTHLPSFVIFFPAFIGYSLIGTARQQEMIWTTTVRMAAAVLLAAGISAVYWLPATGTQGWVSMQAITSGFYSYTNNFLLEGPIINRQAFLPFWRTIERTTFSTLALAVLSWSVSRLSPLGSRRKDANFWVVVASISTFLMLPFSKFLWPILLPLQRIQFPWRINILLVLAGACLTGLALDSIGSWLSSLAHQKRARISWALWWLAALLLYVVIEMAVLRSGLWHGEAATLVRGIRIAAIGTCLGLLVPLLTRPSLLSAGRGLALAFWICLTLALADQSYKSILSLRTDPDRQGPSSTLLAAAEHRPRWVPEKRFSTVALGRWGAETPLIKGLDPDSHAEVLEWRPRSIILKTQATRPSRFLIKQFYFPGWAARVWKQHHGSPLKPSASGLLEVLVPAGDHRMTVTLDPLPLEKAGILATVASLSLCSVLFILNAPKREEPRSGEQVWLPAGAPLHR